MFFVCVCTLSLYRVCKFSTQHEIFLAVFLPVWIWCQTLKRLRVLALAGCAPGTPEERDTPEDGTSGMCLSWQTHKDSPNTDRHTNTHANIHILRRAHTHTDRAVLRVASCQTFFHQTTNHLSSYLLHARTASFSAFSLLLSVSLPHSC